MLRDHFPNHAILGEEGGVSGDPSSGLLWCVDPLDGTTNFTHHYPAFAGQEREADDVKGSNVISINKMNV